MVGDGVAFDVAWRCWNGVGAFDMAGTPFACALYPGYGPWPPGVCDLDVGSPPGVCRGDVPMPSSLGRFDGMTELVWYRGLWKAGEDVRPAPLRKVGF